jgi:hypothetical protein
MKSQKKSPAFPSARDPVPPSLRDGGTDGGRDDSFHDPRQIINPLVKRNRWLAAAGLFELIYGLAEAGDTFYVLLLQARLVPNVQLPWAFPEIGSLMDSLPAAFFPVFAFFSFGRIAAGAGVLRNRMWAFWLTLFLSLVTAVWALFFLPLGGFDMLGCLFIVATLLSGRFGRNAILP